MFLSGQCIKMNDSSGNETVGTCTDPTTRHVLPESLVVTIFVLILSLNIIGNVIVVAVIVFHRKMHTFTNYMIFNLSVADLALGVLCIPLEIPLELNGGNWVYGGTVCTLLYPLQTATVFASVFTLVVLSCSRSVTCITAIVFIHRNRMFSGLLMALYFIKYIHKAQYTYKLKKSNDSKTKKMYKYKI